MELLRKALPVQPARRHFSAVILYGAGTTTERVKFCC
jgi:hypothetical protein